MVILGIDESYTNIGVSVAKDGKTIMFKSYNYKGCKTKTEKRNFTKRMVNYFTKKYKCDIIIVERIRHFSQGFMSKNYIVATASLVAVIIDTAYKYNVPVFSVDTRSWKSKVVGTSKHNKNESSKQPTLDFVRNVLKLDAKNDDEADAICIALYGFIPKNKQKLEREN